MSESQKDNSNGECNQIAKIRVKMMVSIPYGYIMFVFYFVLLKISFFDISCETSIFYGYIGYKATSSFFKKKNLENVDYMNLIF